MFLFKIRVSLLYEIHAPYFTRFCPLFAPYFARFCPIFFTISPLQIIGHYENVYVEYFLVHFGPNLTIMVRVEAVAVTHIKKVKNYGERCERVGMAFLPSRWTRWEDGTRRRWRRSASLVVGRDEGETVQHHWQRLGVILIRDNVNMLASRAPEAVPSQTSGLLSKKNFPS